jgi:hypothetical protein
MDYDLEETEREKAEEIERNVRPLEQVGA